MAALYNFIALPCATASERTEAQHDGMTQSDSRRRRHWQHPMSHDDAIGAHHDGDSEVFRLQSLSAGDGTVDAETV